MLLFDQHLHSNNSTDSETVPAAAVLAALEAGLAGLTFTDHFDTHPTEWPRCLYDYDRLHGEIVALREKYGDRIFIGHGIEVCYQRNRMDFILEYLSSHEFDVVLLSVHWFRGRALHVREHWDGFDTRSGTEAYLETVLDAAKLAGELARGGERVFDVLGHIDLVKRYTQRYFGAFDVHPFEGLIDEILRAAIESDIIPELNASGLRQGIGEPFPNEWAIRRYAELGGRCVSIGSDAHLAEHIGAGLPEAVDLLKRAGIQAIAAFRERQLEAVPIE
jgi:histidinol-phosphatase (PHP family)